MPRAPFSGPQYQGVGGLSPGRSVLDLSHVWSGDMQFGKLYPVVCEECVPGDVVKYGAEVLARMNPSIVPFMHEINISWHAFFIPFRLVWPKVDTTGNDWESYIVGETWDPNSSTFVPVTAVLPVWDYTSASYYAAGSLYDQLGFQPGVIPAVGSRPHALWSRSYALVWNEWYRDEDLQVPLDYKLPLAALLDSAMEKDYFTSARPFQQKGISPAIPISGVSSAVFPDSDFYNGLPAAGINMVAETFNAAAPFIYTNNANAKANVKAAFNNNTVNLGVGVGVNMADLRLSMQIQKYLERNARSGNRYVEWLMAHYGVSPRDERLQRPEYLGGGKVPVVVSEVLQTSATVSGQTAQGTMAGHGISVSRSGVVSGYRVEEFGTFMVLARILPRTMYTQGVHRRAIRNSPYEFYHVEFAHLAEQAVTKGELYVTGTATDNQVFGYQARFQEYRARNSVAVGEMRNTLKQWNLGRSFAAQPGLNAAFISVTDTQRTQWMQRAYAVTSQAPFLVSFGNHLIMSRPMPGMPEPGLMDHF